MLEVIGTQGCGKCLAVKNILSNKGISYEYKLYEELDKEDFQRVESRIKSFPLILQDNKEIKLEEI